MRLCTATVMCSPNHTPGFVADWVQLIEKNFKREAPQLQLATTPFASWLPADKTCAAYAAEYEAVWLDRGISALSMGCLSLEQDDMWIEKAVEIIANSSCTYLNIELGDKNGLNLNRTNSVAQAFKYLSELKDRPGAEHFLAATIGCPMSLGHLPAATSNGLFGYTLSIESAETVSPSEQSQFLAEHAIKAEDIARESAIPFLGFDLSLMPLPEGELSGENSPIDATISQSNIRIVHATTLKKCSFDSSQSTIDINQSLIKHAETFSEHQQPMVIQPARYLV